MYLLKLRQDKNILKPYLNLYHHLEDMLWNKTFVYSISSRPVQKGQKQKQFCQFKFKYFFK